MSFLHGKAAIFYKNDRWNLPPADFRSMRGTNYPRKLR
jgi:hypothetical protein